MTTVRISIDGKKILAEFPPYTRRVEAEKVPGIISAKWDKSVEPKRFIGWTYPLELETCYAFRRAFGTDLMVANDLAAWARIEIGKRNELEALREGETTDLKLERLAKEAPQLILAAGSRPYQPTGIAFIVSARHTILGDEPGLGKTIQTLGALVEHGAKNILVACKKSAAYSVWQDETVRWAPSIHPYVAQGARQDRELEMSSWYHDDFPHRMLIVNSEMLRAKRQEICPEGLDPEYCNSRPSQARGDHRHTYKAFPEWPFLFEQDWDAIILDESHNLLASTANIQSKRITQSRFGVMQIRRRLKKDGLAIALSGTPFRSNLTNGWGTLNWLDPEKFTSYWRWAEQFFGVTEERAGYRTVKVVGDGSKTPEPIDKDAWGSMLRPYYLARKKAEVAADLPPIIFAGTPPEGDPNGPCYVRLVMEDKQYNAYHQMSQDAEADVEGGTVLATGILAENTRLRQFATSFGTLGDNNKVYPTLPSNKMDWIVDFMRERESTGAKVVIASLFTEVVELAADILRKEGWEVLTLTGATSGKNRTLLQKRFQDPDDPLRVVIINTKAGGESINLDRADDMIVIDDPWKSDTSKQLYDRIHRVSRVHQVTVYRLISVDTIEEKIANLNEEQRRALEAGDIKKLSELTMEGAK